MRGLKKFFLGLFISFFVIDSTLAFFGVGESTLLSKILVEDVRQTLRLSEIMKMAGNELKVLNEKYGFQKWINKGLDDVKDYGLLEKLKTDDYILGTFQDDMGVFGVSVNENNFQLNNLDEWIETVWGISPEVANGETKYSGNFGDWQKQFKGEIPAVYSTKSSLRSIVNRKNSQLALNHFIYNHDFNSKVRDQYKQLQIDATKANPGVASRMTAQSNALQNLQLANMNDTQSIMLRMMALRHLDEQQNDDLEIFSFKNSFLGIQKMMKGVPTFGK